MILFYEASKIVKGIEVEKNGSYQEEGDGG